MKMVLAALYALSAFCSPSAVLSQVNGSAESEVRSVMAQLKKASAEGDSDTVASLMTDEYVQTDISGHVQDKVTWLKEYFNPVAELILAGKFRWEVYDRKDIQILVYGESAVVIGTLEAKGSGAKWVPGVVPRALASDRQFLC